MARQIKSHHFFLLLTQPHLCSESRDLWTAGCWSHVILVVVFLTSSVTIFPFFSFYPSLSERDHLLVVLSGLIFYCRWALNLAGEENHAAGFFQSAERLSFQYFNPTYRYQYPVFRYCEQPSSVLAPVVLKSECPLKKRKRAIKTSPTVQRNPRLQPVSFFVCLYVCICLAAKFMISYIAHRE